MIAVFDTETSGLWRDALDPLDASQPHICQIGVKRFDGRGKIVGSFSALIKPDGWTMEREAESVHGIREIDCVRHGVPLWRALASFQTQIEAAMFIVAHHVAFDARLVDISLHRVGAAGAWWRSRSKSRRCTMEAATPICQMPGQYGFKFPSLEEAHAILLPTHVPPFKSAHNVDDDIAACFRIYEEIERRGGFAD